MSLLIRNVSASVTCECSSCLTHWRLWKGNEVRRLEIKELILDVWCKQYLHNVIEWLALVSRDFVKGSSARVNIWKEKAPPRPTPPPCSPPLGTWSQKGWLAFAGVRGEIGLPRSKESGYIAEMVYLALHREEDFLLKQGKENQQLCMAGHVKRVSVELYLSRDEKPKTEIKVPGRNLTWSSDLPHIISDCFSVFYRYVQL